MDRAEAWLLTCEARLRDSMHDPDWIGRRRDEAHQAVDALVSVGVLSGDRAVLWTQRLSAGSPHLPGAGSPAALEQAELFLGELLDACGDDPESNEDGLHRFEGALIMLAGAGLANAQKWDRRLRERAGWPSVEEEQREVAELNKGSTQSELLSVIEGHNERRSGYRVVYGLVFADGLNFLIDSTGSEAASLDWADWVLHDDAGREYRAEGSSGSDTEQHCSFSPAPASSAQWLELSLEGESDVAFRIAL